MLFYFQCFCVKFEFSMPPVVLLNDQNQLTLIFLLFFLVMNANGELMKFTTVEDNNVCFDGPLISANN